MTKRWALAAVFTLAVATPAAHGQGWVGVVGCGASPSLTRGFEITYQKRSSRFSLSLGLGSGPGYALYTGTVWPARRVVVLVLAVTVPKWASIGRRLRRGRLIRPRRFARRSESRPSGRNRRRPPSHRGGNRHRCFRRSFRKPTRARKPTRSRSSR